MTKYVALYCRLSPRPDGSYEGVDAQEKWGGTYAAATWPGLPVRVFSDAGISAASGDHRPQFEALREAVARGEVAHLWCVEQTRLERREVEWFRLAAELDAAGITELHTNRDGIVRVRDEVAGIKAVLAAGEVRKLKRRVNDRLAELAAAGRPAGARVYGYRHGLDEQGGKTLLIVPEEAAVIRDAAEKVLAGWSLSRITADLRARRLHGAHRRKVRDAAGEVVKDANDQPVTRPSTFTITTVQSMLTNGTVAGWRTHQGRQTRGVWEPILDQQTWDNVRDKLTAPRTVDRTGGGTYPISAISRVTGRRYLLTSGIAVCGVCKFPLIASLKQLKGGRKIVPYYLCHKRTGGGSCIGIMADPLEEYVVNRMLDELDKPAFVEALAEDEHAARRDEITAALRASDDRRNALAAQWGAGELTDEEWRAARASRAERERELRAELAAVPPPVSKVDVAAIRAGWSAMNLDERREIIGMFVERVVVKRARPGAQTFDENRVGDDGIEWRRR